jgi:hypothetical protein
VKEEAIADRHVLSLPGVEGGRCYPLPQPRSTIAPSPTVPVVAVTSKSTSVTKPVPPTGTLLATPKPRPQARPTGPTKLPATPVMEEVVRDALGISASGDLTADEMSELTELDASEREIQNLVGLEGAFNLTDLVLDHNHISNLKPLVVLTNLTSLHLSDNQIISIAPLESLINLLELDLSYNQFNDIGPLATNLGLADGTHVIVDEHPFGLWNCSQDLQDIRSMQRRGMRVKQGPMVATPAAQTVPQPGATVEITDGPRIKVVRLRTVLGLAMKVGRTEEGADFRQVGAVQIWFGSAEQYGPDLAMMSVTISEAKHRDVIRFTQMVDA